MGAMCCCFKCLNSWPKWGCCGGLTLIGSGMMYALAFWAFHLHDSLTPVFTDVDCSLTAPKINKVSFTGGFHVDFTTATECHNPNPYIVKMKSNKGVDVFMGEKRIKVASVENIPDTILPARGTGRIVVEVKMAPTRQSWGAMFGVLFSATTPIYIQNNIALSIDLNFFFTRFKVGKAFTKDCGFQLAIFRSALAKMGPLACANTFDELVLPPVGEESFDGKLDLQAGNLAASEIKAGTWAKDVGLGVAMLSGCFWGSVFLAGCFWSCCRCQQHLRGKRGGDSARQATVKRPRQRRMQRGGAAQEGGAGALDANSVAIDVNGGAADGPEAAGKQEN